VTKAGAEMAGLVIDSSVALAWFLPGEGSSQTLALLEQTTEEGALVPGLWRIEIANVLLVAERRRRITEAQRMRALAALGSLPIRTDPNMADHAWTTILEIAAAHELTVYDAAYLELSLRAALPLATLDDALQRAARTIGVVLLGHR